MAKTTKRYPHEPEYAVAPGEVLQETIEALCMTQADLATRTGLSRKTINLITHGHEPLTCETALRLERVTGVPAHFWNNLESRYREKLVRLAEKQRLAEDLAWMETIPTKELIRHGAIGPQKSSIELLQAVLRFFGVNSAQEWKAVWTDSQVGFQKLPLFRTCPGAIATWLRLGELEGRNIACQPFDRERFRAALLEARKLTAQPSELFVLKLRELFAAAGVAVVLVREIRGAHIRGAAQWLSPDKALIQLTPCAKSNDLFWFTFFHEAGHIFKHGKKEKFVDDGQVTNEHEEEEANRFAADMLQRSIVRQRVSLPVSAGATART